jgi:arsenate reductase
MNILYGIPNCDTVRKARKWLTAAAVDFHFHDLRRDGLTRSQLERWVGEVGWETLLNKRGTTWRQLPAGQREGLDEARAITLLLEHPAMIKRPVLESDALPQIEVGFSEPRYSEIFAQP